LFDNRVWSVKVSGPLIQQPTKQSRISRLNRPQLFLLYEYNSLFDNRVWSVKVSGSLIQQPTKQSRISPLNRPQRLPSTSFAILTESHSNLDNLCTWYSIVKKWRTSPHVLFLAMQSHCFALGRESCNPRNIKQRDENSHYPLAATQVRSYERIEVSTLKSDNYITAHRHESNKCSTSKQQCAQRMFIVRRCHVPPVSRPHHTSTRPAGHFSRAQFLGEVSRFILYGTLLRLSNQGDWDEQDKQQHGARGGGGFRN
jgi:hypothetical protein